MPKKPFKERLLSIVGLVIVAAATIWFVNHLHLSGHIGTIINVIIVLLVLLFFFVK
jgi:uncharacterized membrane protein